MGTTNIVVLLSLIASAVAGPISQESDTCSTQCPTSSKFKYSPGTTYIYDYRVDTESSLAGAFEDSAKTTIQTTVNIEVLSPCEFALQLRNTRLFHTDGTGALKTADRENEFRSEVEGSPLRFSFQNGIVDHVCSENEDSVRSLNLKKGILSAFQNSQDDLYKSQNVTETDVAGVCKTEYKVVSSGYYTTDIKKVKNILSCTDRLDFLTMLQFTDYKVPSDLQNLPIMKTSHECEQEVKNGGILKSSICKESHIYRPFANGKNGGRIAVTQTLTYQTYKNGVSIRARDVMSRSSLIFDHSADHPTQKESRDVVNQKLLEICDTTHTDIRPETPQLFSELVVAMKRLDKKALTYFHDELHQKKMCSSNGRTYKYFHDALPMVSTSASVSLMTDLILIKDVTGLETTAWLTSFAFIKNPTSDMLLDVKALLDNKEVRKDAMLPVSSMVNNFCKKVSTCNNNQAVVSIMSALEGNIDYYCDASGEKFELTLLTLKAIGNAGHATQAIPVINKCLASTSNPLEIRVIAAEAFRRMPCPSEDKDLWDVFTNKELDSELRINVYLALMRCPTKANLEKIAAVLNDEEDEQVGAFVYSHLTNLRETSDPHKQAMADAINNLALDKQFDLSPLKYSRNFEVSALINKINTGVTAESNLIWSNKAQLPRAVSGNLTVELFGQSINLLDFGGRLEGLEYLIKNIFGPYVNSKEKDSKSKINADNVKGSIFGRLFGNELLFLHSQTTKSLFGDKSASWLDFMIKLADKQDVALTQTVQFMDLCMVIPSSAGLPIHARVNGTATVDLNMSGKMDLRKIGSSPRSMDVDGEIRPSAALEITGTMFVDSLVTKTGLRMRNTMHTSTAIKGRVQMNRGQQLSVELDTPEDKLEVFDARSRFFVIHNDMEQEQEMIKENRKEFKTCSSKQLTTLTGMEICGELSFPNASMKADSPYYPLTGPTAVSVTLFKRDSHSGYKLFAKKVQNRKASIAQISINTPGSQVDRAISMDMSLNYRKQNAELNVATPWKKLALNGNLKNLDDLKSLSGNLIIDDKDTYAMTGEVKVTQSKNKLQLNPMIEFRRPGADNVQVNGFIAMEKPLKSLNMEMSLSGIKDLPCTIKTSLTNNKKEKSIETSLSLDGKSEYSFKASHLMTLNNKKSVVAVIKNSLEIQSPKRQLVALSSNVDYRQEKSLRLDSSIYMYRVLRRPATLKVNFQSSSRRKADNYKGIINVKSSHLSGTINSNLVKKSTGLLSLTSKIDYTIPKYSKNTITFSGKLNDRSTKVYKSYDVQSIIGVKRNPEYNSNIKLKIGHKKKLTSVDMDVKYGADPKDKTKRVHVMTSLSKKTVTLKNANVNYKLQAQAPAHGIDIRLTGKHEHTPKMIESNAQLTYAPKKEINAGISLRDRSSKLAKINGKAALSWPGKEYSVSTDLTQKTVKQYNHNLNLKSSSGTEHKISTVYRVPKTDSYDVSTNWKLHGMKPVSVSGSTNLNLKNFAASGEYKTGKNVYGFSSTSKITKGPNARFSLELLHPERRVTLDLNGVKSKAKYEGKVVAAWDADRNNDSKISLEGEYFQKSAKGATSLGGNVNFQSPFEGYKNLLGSVKYGSDPSELNANGKFRWGDRSQIASAMNLKKPFSFNNLKLNGNIKTPFKGIRNAEINIAHKLDSDLSTTIKGNLEKENAKLSILGKSLNNGYQGKMNLKSTIKNAESVTASISHTGKDSSCTSNAEMNHNGKVYAYDLNLSHSGDGWQRKTNGDLVLTYKKQKLATHWDHMNTDELLHSTLSSKWADKRFLFDLNGSHKLSDLRKISGVLKVKSPWKPVEAIEVKVDHKHGTGLINSIASLKQGSDKKASSSIKYNGGNNNADLDFEIVSPFHDDISGKLSTNFENYPMTTSAELKWAPKMKGTLEGSLNLESWDNADLNLKMTTPSRTLRNVVLKASNKKQNGELVSHLNLDYGLRQNIDIESHIANEEQMKLLRLKVKSPFEHMKSLNTGLIFYGHASKFDTNVDFELLPNIGKFDGAMNWQFDDVLKGKIRLDTPFPEYPYFELSASSMREGKLTQSQIQAEYYPRQVFSLDATHRLVEFPLLFDGIIRSPYPEFNDIGLSFQHNMEEFSIKSHGEVKYQSDKKIEGELNADWAKNMEGNLLVKTPFRGYETNKISLRHRGELNNFDSHGEISVADQSIVTDASFKSGYTTTGTFTFTSPIPGLEKIDASIKKRGNQKSFKASAIVDINGDKIQTTVSNKLMKDTLKTGFNLMTPYTENFKFGLEHSGLPKSFTNKININYGRKVDIDTIASFDLRENDVNGNGILKYKLDGGRNTARVFFSKSGTIEDISFTTTTGFNKKEISVNGALKTVDGIDGSLKIKTPFNNFKTTGMTLSHSGDLTDFTTNTNINYMDNKNINAKLEFSNVAGNGVKLTSELTTPFKNFESTSFKFNHDITPYSNDISGTAVLTTTIGKFGTGDISYNKVGDLNDIVLKGSVSASGKDLAVLRLTNKMTNSEVHSMCSLKSSVTPDVYLSIDHTGDSYRLSTKTTAKIGKNMVSADAAMKKDYDSFSADSSIIYKLQGQGKNKASISLTKEGSLENCHMELIGKFNDDEAKLSTSKSGSFDDMHFSTSASYNKDSIDINGGWKNTGNIEGTLKVLTPFNDFKNLGIVLSHTGELSDFTTSLKMNYMDGKNINGKVELTAKTLENIKFVSELTTPFENLESLDLKFDNKIDSYTSELTGNAAIDTSIAGFGSGSIVYSKTGSLTNLEVTGKALRNSVEIAELKITNALRDQELHSSFEYKSTVTPQLKLTLDHNGDLTNLKTSARAALGNKNIINGEATLSQRGNTFDAEGKVMYTIEDYGSNQVSLNIHREGQLNNFNVELTGKYDGKIAKITSNFKNENGLNGDLTIITPIEGFKNVGLSFKHSGSIERFNSEGKLVLSDGEEYSGKIDHYNYLLQRIETVLELKTPVPDFEFTKFEYRHEGESDGFKCISTLEYGKSQRITYDLSVTSSPKPQFTVTLKMPENELMASGSYENTWPKYAINGKVDAGSGNSITLDGSIDASDDIVGVLSLSTPIEDFKNIGLNFQHSLKSDSLNTEGRITYMDGKVISGKVDAALSRNSQQELQHIETVFELKTPVPDFEFTKFEYRHEGESDGFKCISALEYGKSQRITYDLSVTSSPKPQFTVTLKMPENELMASGSYENTWPKYAISGKVDAGSGNSITLDGSIDASDDIVGVLSLSTPIEDFKNIGLNFQHSLKSDSLNTEGRITYMDGKVISGKVDAAISRNSQQELQHIETVFELKTPVPDFEFTKFEYRHELESDGFKCISTLEYGKSQRITYDLSVTSSPKPQFTVTLKMPENELMASGSYENTWPKYAISGKVDLGSGNSITLDGSIDASDDIVGVLSLSTPIEDFKNIGLNFQHSLKSDSLNTEGRITYMDGKVISGKVDAAVSKNSQQSSLELTTPFKGYEFTRYETKHVFNKRIIKGTHTLIYGDKRIVMDAYSKLKKSPEFSVTITSPYYQDFEVFVSFDNTWPKYDLTCKLSPGNGQQFTLDGVFDASKDISGSLKIGTPFDGFNKIGMELLHSGNIEKFDTEGTLTYMDGQDIIGKVNFYKYMWRRIDGSFELKTPFVGMELTKAGVNFEDNSVSISTTAAVEYNGEKLNGNVKITYSPNYEVVVTLNTPFIEYNVIRAQGSLDLTDPSYEAICSLSYGYNTVYSANAKFNLYDAEHMDGSLEVNTPLSGFEFTKAEYQHKADSNELVGSVSLTYDDGKKISCDIKSTLSPNFDGTVTVMTPFRGFEQLQATGTFESSYNKYETSSSLNLGQGSIFSMSSELDYSIEPMRASTKISTPFKDFRNVQLDITHEGGLTNFKTSGFLSSPLTDHVNAKASLRYDAIMDMSAAASLQSSIEGFDDLKAELKTSDLAGEMKSNVVIGWTSGRQIAYEGVFRKQDGWNEDKIHTDVSISTPFIAVRSANLQMDHSAQTDSYVEKMAFELNGEILVDLEAECNFNDKQSAELTVRQPWPMQYTVSKSSSDGIIDAEALFNWNRDESNSNVRIQATVTDKSDSYQTENGIDISVTHASRKVGVVQKMSNKPSQLMSNGYIYWNSDDDSKVSYDLQVSDNSRRRKQIVDGSFKLGLPTRTLGLTGSYSENAALVSTETIFSWDADRDDSKQVGVKTTVRRGDTLKGDISLSMPSLRKKIRVNGEIMLNNGRVILDAKTDISYSRDSSKTLTLTSKLEDISTHDSHFNYSLVLGLKQPHTNVDIEMNTHVGSSDERMTVGMNTNYLTNKRETKNLALLSEINLLKKQISMQIFNPVNKIEIVGDVVSENPCKLRLLNRIDDEEILRCDMTVDKERKAFSLNAFTDSNMLSFSAKYPNSTAFHIEFNRHTPDFDQKEAMLAVRLNTTRLMHTRLSWRPDMMKELTDFMLPKAFMNAGSTLSTLKTINNAVAEEVTGKYVAIANELTGELYPYITALEGELALIGEKMDELSAEIKEMYNRNDFYVQKLGERVLELQENLQRQTELYKLAYTTLIESLKEGLKEIRQFPIGAHYSELVNDGASWLLTETISSISSFNQFMSKVNLILEEYKASLQELKQRAMNTVSNATYVDYLANRINQVQNIDVSPYVSSFQLPEEYTNTIYDVHSKINDKLNQVFNGSQAQFVKEGLNEVYQQGIWAYNYWEIEENFQKQIRIFLKTLKDIAKDEIKEYSQDLKIGNPITVWDTEHGEIQADIPLPVAVQSLDELPDITPLINKVEKIAVTYLPDKGTWDSLVKSVSDMWPNKTDNSILIQDLSSLKPSRNIQRRGRYYKIKRAGQ